MLLMFGCSRSAKETVLNIDRDRLIYPLTVNPTSYDVATVSDPRTYTGLLQHIYDRLLVYDTNNNIVPSIAEDWEVSHNYKKYTFYLKKNLVSHDNQPINAYNVKHSIERACHPDLVSSTAEKAFSTLKGFTDYNQGIKKSIDGIEVVNEYTVKFHLHRTDSGFLSKLTYPVASIVPLSTKIAPITDYEELVGTGAYKVEEIVPSSLIKLSYFNSFHTRCKCFKNIEIPIVTDLNSLVAKFKNKEFHFCEISPDDVRSAVDDKELQNKLLKVPSGSLFYTELSAIAYKPFENPLIRQAIYHGINLVDIEDTILNGTKMYVANSIFRNVESNFDNIVQFNPSWSKSLLRRAGYNSGSDLPELVIYAPEHRKLGRAIAERMCLHLKQNLNINCRVGVIVWNDYLKKLSRSKLPMAIHRYTPNSLNVQLVLEDLLLSSKNVMKYSKYNKTFQQALNKLNAVAMPEFSVSICNDIQKIVNRERLIMPLFVKDDVYLVQDGVDKLQFNFQGPMHLNKAVYRNRF